MTLEELLALSTDEMTVEELRDHQAAIIAAMTALAESDEGRSDASLELLDQAAEAVETVATSIHEAEEADAEADRRAQAALERAQAAAGQAGDGDDGESGEGDGDGDGDEGDGDAGDGSEGGDGEGGDGDEGTEGGASASTEDGAEGEGDDGAGDGEGDELAAGGAKKGVISKMNARRPPAARPRVRKPADGEMTLIASANAPGVATGARLSSYSQVAKIFEDAIRAGRGYRGPAVNVPLVYATSEFDERFTLSESAKDNERKLSEIRQGVRREGSLKDLAAAGGACAPFDVRYDQPFIGSDARPVRDNILNRMNVPRGGVTVLPTVKYTQLNGAVAFWDDIAGHVVDEPSLTAKPIREVDCEDPYDVGTYEVTERLRFGTIKSRYFPERVEAIMKALAVAQARKADTRLLESLGSPSTPDGGAVQTTSHKLVGATRDLLTTLDRSLAAWRSAYRLDRSTPLAFAHPDWLFDMLRADLTRGAEGSTDDRLATADAKIAALIAARNVVSKPFMDGESGQVFDFQGDGPVQGWPQDVVTYLYPDGDAHFLDGGTIEFGLVRDSGLIEINKHEMFAETTEGFLYHSSVDRYRLSLDLCADGTSTGPVTLEGVCATGS